MMRERVTSRKNPLLQNVRKLLSSRSARQKEGLFAADGTKLLEEAIRYWPGLDTVILSDGVEADLPAHVRLISVPEDVMPSISPMEAPQGAIFLCRMPELQSLTVEPGSLILDGIVGGVGAVLGFVPQILVLFIMLAFLEACGYMSRIAFVLDRIFRKFGLSGKSIIPMLVATGCGVPGILASRTIEQENDRKITVMTTGFIPCGAKMPVVGLIGVDWGYGFDAPFGSNERSGSQFHFVLGQQF